VVVTPRARPAPTSADDDALVLPSPSMIAPSPLRSAVEPTPLPPAVEPEPRGRSIFLDETQPDQLPPRPVADSVPMATFVAALREVEERAARRLMVAFLLGSFASVLGFVTARWAMTALGD
jgi:hypothetical protein